MSINSWGFGLSYGIKYIHVTLKINLLKEKVSWRVLRTWRVLLYLLNVCGTITNSWSWASTKSHACMSWSKFHQFCTLSVYPSASADLPRVDLLDSMHNICGDLTWCQETCCSWDDLSPLYYCILCYFALISTTRLHIPIQQQVKMLRASFKYIIFPDKQLDCPACVEAFPKSIDVLVKLPRLWSNSEVLLTSRIMVVSTLSLAWLLTAVAWASSRLVIPMALITDDGIQQPGNNLLAYNF